MQNGSQSLAICETHCALRWSRGTACLLARVRRVIRGEARSSVALSSFPFFFSLLMHPTKLWFIALPSSPACATKTENVFMSTDISVCFNGVDNVQKTFPCSNSTDSCLLRSLHAVRFSGACLWRWNPRSPTGACIHDQAFVFAKCVALQTEVAQRGGYCRNSRYMQTEVS